MTLHSAFRRETLANLVVFHKFLLEFPLSKTLDTLGVDALDIADAMDSRDSILKVTSETLDKLGA